MKRCPECSKDYLDDSLLYCLDDGTPLVQGSVTVSSFADEPKTAILSGITKPTAKAGGRISGLMMAAGMILALLLGGLGVWLFRPASSAHPLRKLDLHLRGAVQQRDLAYSISPNGRMIAYVRENKLWIRDLEKTVPQEVANSQGADVPFWSPDSSHLGYFVEKKLFKVSNTGSGSIELAATPAVMTGSGGASWGNDGSIVFATGERGLLKVSAQGGVPTQLVDVGADETDFHGASYLPEDRGVLFTLHRGKDGANAIEVFDGASRKRILEVPGAWLADPVYSSTGHILFARSNSPPVGIWALPFSLSKLEATGEPFLVASGGSIPSVSNDGSLLYSSRTTNVPSRLVWVDRAGNVVKRIQNEDVPNQWPSARLSPDEKQIVLTINDRATGMDPVVVDVTSGSMTRIASQVDNNGAWFCTWTADGENVAYLKRTNTNNIAIRSANGTASENLLVEARDASFTPDGKFVIYTVAPSGYSSSDIWYRSLEDGRQPIQFVVTDFIELSPEFSPDGKFVAYVSNETGSEEVFVKAFPDDGRKWQVSKQGGAVPRWSKRSSELFFNSGNRIVSVTYAISPKVEFGTPQQLFEYQPLNQERISGSFESFDVSHDGQRFVLLQQAPNQTSGMTLTFVQNWYEEFKGK